MDGCEKLSFALDAKKRYTQYQFEILFWGTK